MIPINLNFHLKQTGDGSTFGEQFAILLLMYYFVNGETLLGI